MRDVKSSVQNQVAIAEFRIEDLAAGGGFRVFFRRQLGGQSLFIFAAMLAFAGLGVWVMSGFVAGAWRGMASGGRKGPPICCLPFVLGFFALWLSVPLGGLAAHWRGAMGREEWAFGSECVTPATSLMNEAAPLPLAGEVRAGVSRVGGRWVVGISCRGHDLVVGPFRTEALARAFEGELRVRRPEWFAAGSAAAAAASGASSWDGGGE